MCSQEIHAVQNEMDSIVIRYSYFFGQARIFDYFEMLKDLHDTSKQDNGKKEVIREWLHIDIVKIS